VDDGEAFCLQDVLELPVGVQTARLWLAAGWFFDELRRSSDEITGSILFVYMYHTI
jgi:hypothetical protein